MSITLEDQRRQSRLGYTILFCLLAAGAIALVITAVGGGAKPTTEVVRAPIPTPLFIGDRAVLTMTIPACSDFDAWERILQLASENDAAATAIALASQRSCRTLNKGDIVRVEDYSFMRSSNCVRPIGVPVCYWTRSGALRKADS
jgi:hypothetical protein